MGKRIVGAVPECDDAEALGAALTRTATDYSGHVVYVKLWGGAIVFGYDVEEETLSDGSIVYNVLLRAT
jgi:hypothetical protein